ncbi:nitrate ABC transporter substrate-binding protein [Christensenellaceae bacterium]|nr:nitrate ABC transporter substrate-binding protein [Christensenellaceae bacterium]BDF62178.1 nitrate ABC transporter substrate-binding protein [Christensenellaceae bacterium]
MKVLHVELDWFANTNHTGFYVALNKGYYRDLGIDVHINGEFGGCGHQFAGQPDIVVAPEPAMLVYMDEAKKEDQATAIAVLTQRNDSGIISLKSCGATRPRELMGKRLTHWTPQWFHAVIGYAVNEDGGDYSKVRLVTKDVGDIVETLGADGDAVWIYKNWEWFVMKHAGKDCDYFALADFYDVMDFCAPAVAAKNALIESDPQAVRAFIKASDQGFIDAANDPVSAAKILHGYTPHFDLDLLIESQEYIAGLYLNEQGHWGTIRPQRWTAFSAFMKEQGMIQTDYAASGERFTNEFHD